MSRSRTEKRARIGRRLLRGESAIGTIGAALAGILLCAMAASAWWAVRTQRQHIHRATVEEVRSAGSLLASLSESMLGRGEVFSLRRLIADAGRNHRLDACRIVLPGGGIVADARPGRIDVHELPAPPLEGGVVASVTQSVRDGRVELRHPLSWPGGGRAELHIARTIRQPVGALWEAASGVGLIGAAAMCALLLVYRRSRLRLRAMEAIREQLLAVEGGAAIGAALAVREELGPEAAAWNRLLEHTDRTHRAAMMDRARDSLSRHHHGRGALDEACDAMPQGLVLVDERLHVRYANGAAASILGLDRRELMRSDIRRHIGDPLVLEALEGWRSGRSRRRTVVESHNGKAEGVMRWLIRPVRRSDGGSAMIVIEDITQQRVAEEARHTFVTQATHELRAPLTNIRLYVETALDEGGRDEALRAKCLNVINSESRRLERIVSDLLSTAEIEAGQLQAARDDVRLEDVFEELRADYQMQAKEKDLELTFDLPPKLPVIQGDRDLIVLALHNLLDNALKYTPAGGQVTLKVEAAGGELVVEVSDTGIGIGPDDLRRVFEKFYRARDRRLAQISGSGLGLALAREVVRLHGGDVTVQSELDRGSTFTMTLPGRDEAA